MGRNRCVRLDACIYRGSPETEIEVEVIGLLEPYFSGSWEEPLSGGEVEDVQAIFIDGKKRRAIELTDEESELFADRLAEEAMESEPPEHEFYLDREIFEYEEPVYDE